MKLLRYGAPGEELPGLLDEMGIVRSLSPVVRDIDATVFCPEGLRFLEALVPAKLPAVSGAVRFGPPVARFREIIAVGLNYREHAQESHEPSPQEPIVFSKSLSSINGPDDDIVLPPGSKKTDWEIELGIVIGKKASRVSPEQAREHVAGYCLVNDVSERCWQLERGGQFGKGKSFDTFTPVGPWLVTASELPDPQNITLHLDVNGEAMQRGNTRDMIFGVDVIVSYISTFMTLCPGDLISTGTPNGVGFARNPPRFLKQGDRITMTTDVLGAQSHRVVGG
jgi:ureidoglycolate lyase